MLGVLKLATPLATVITLALHQLTGAAAAPTIGLTDVAGVAADCSAPTASAACASLFRSAAQLYPGGPAEVVKVTVGYHAGPPSHAFGVYLPTFSSRHDANAPTCSAADPAGKLDLTIAQGARPIYQGTLAAFATAHSAPASMLHLRGGRDGSGAVDRWRDGDRSTFTITVALNASADNAYMGCVSSADIAWLAAT